MADSANAAEFHARLKGRFDGIVQWNQLNELLDRVKAGAWYFYQLGEALPTDRCH